MKRIISVLAVMAIMAAMVAATAVPAFAASDKSDKSGQGQCNCVPRIASQGKLGGRLVSEVAQGEVEDIDISVSELATCGGR